MHNFFLQLMAILLTARVLGEIAVRCKIPAIIGELAAGILIGPSLLNWVQPTETIRVLAEIGIVLLLFEVGLETEVARLAKTGSKPFIVALGGIILPFALGFFISRQLFDLSMSTSLFFGSALTATSIGITVRVLTDLKRQASDEAQIVLGAAVIDDVIGIILLSIVYDFASGGEVDPVGIGKILIFILLFLLLAPVTAKLISVIIKHYANKSEIPGLVPTAMVSLILFFAWVAQKVGAPELLGGLAAGLALSRQFILPFGKFFDFDKRFSLQVEKQMKPIIHLFAPMFFVTVGLSLNLSAINWNSQFVWLFSGALLLTAIIGKFASGFLLHGEKKWIKWAVGLAMIPRGEVGLIFAEVGLSKKIINDDLYAAMIIVVSITTIFTPFALRYFYNKKPEDPSPIPDASTTGPDF